MTGTRSRRPALLAAATLCAALAVGGCSDWSNPLEDLSIAGVNPFGEKEQRLPGERRPAFSNPETQGGMAQATGAVSIPGPTANGDWSQPGGVASNAPGHLALAGGGGAAWSVSVARLDKRGRLAISPIVHQGMVVVMDPEGTVSAYSLSGGGRVWSTSVRPEDERGIGFGGGIAGSGNILAVATGYGTMVGLDVATGGQAWTANIAAPARSAPTVADGRAYVVTADNILYAISIADGSIAWSYTGIGQTAGVLGNASPAVGGGRVIVPYTSGEIIAFDTASGEPVWFDALTGTNRFTVVSGLNDVVARPVIHEGTVYAVSVSGRMIAVSLRDGERLWAQGIASAHTPAVAGNTVFVATLSGEVLALDRSSGALRWRADIAQGGSVALAGPLLAGGQLWVGTSDGRVITLDPASGNVVNSHSIGNPIYLAPIAASGRIFILDNGGKLTALN